MKPFIVFDLDGTLALTHQRDHFIQGRRKDWRGFFAACVDDKPNEPVMAIFRALKAQGLRIEIWSGRSDEVRSETESWLASHDIHADKLRMRKQGDFTPDQILKESWLKENDEKPLVIFDDRDKVVAMWRHHGITCLQVAEGNF
jgi:hypothetical protein